MQQVILWSGSLMAGVVSKVKRVDRDCSWATAAVPALRKTPQSG